MGGGDLNSKKSWHPNTIKNQERVWKAEQAAAEEKKRILDLQRERGEERDREELNNIAKLNAGSMASDDRLHWMYNKPDKKIQEEDYLLGKAIDSNYEKNEKADQDIIPAVARRVVGSSMITTAGDTQVDLARKMREDPLLLVKERERAARAALLNNPLQRRRLADLLKKEQEQRNEVKEKKKSKKKEKDLDNLLAAKLSALGSEQNLDIGTLLASDNSSSSSSSDSEKSKIKKQKKRKKSKKSKKHKLRSAEVSSDEDSKTSKKFSSKSIKTTKVQKLKKTKKQKYKKQKRTQKYDSSEESKNATPEKLSNKRKNESDVNQHKKHRERSYSEDRNIYKTDKSRKELEDGKLDRQRSKSKELSSRSRSAINNMTEENIKLSGKERSNVDSVNGERRKNNTDRTGDRRNRNANRKRSHSEERPHDTVYRSSSSTIKRRRSKSEDKRDDKMTKRVGLTDEEKAARLAEMAAAGAEHERERGKRVAEQRVETEVSKGVYRRSNNEARSLPDSLQSRIHSNRHYIQRNERHMNEHFARR